MTNASAVVAHPGEDHAHRVGPRRLGSGPEQHVDARAVTADGRTLVQLDHELEVAAHDPEVAVASRQQRSAPRHAIAR